MSESYRRCLIASLVLMLTNAVGANGRPSEPTEPLSLTVRTYNYAGAPESVLGPAREVAAGVFRKLGVQVAWADCTPGNEDAPSQPACRPRPVIQTDVLNLKIISREMAERVRGLFPTDTFGFALPAQGDGFGSNATIFYHSAEGLAGDAKLPVATILGHILAHEMGHLLLGMKGHSPHGIMRIPWGPKELGKSAQGALRFVAKQERRIRARVRARMAAAAQAAGGRDSQGSFVGAGGQKPSDENDAEPWRLKSAASEE